MTKKEAIDFLADLLKSPCVAYVQDATSKSEGTRYKKEFKLSQEIKVELIKALTKD